MEIPQARLARRTAAAEFHGLKPLDDLDWSVNPPFHRQEIFQLATCNFIREAKDVLFLRRPGVGKSALDMPWATKRSKPAFWLRRSKRHEDKGKNRSHADQFHIQSGPTAHLV